MREIGYSDTSVNKNMKFITKSFYDILFKCENYANMNNTQKKLFLSKYLILQKTDKTFDNSDLMKYFEKYYSFCFDLSLDSVLKGEFKYNIN